MFTSPKGTHQITEPPSRFQRPTNSRAPCSIIRGVGRVHWFPHNFGTRKFLQSVHPTLQLHSQVLAQVWLAEPTVKGPGHLIPSYCSTQTLQWWVKGRGGCTWGGGGKGYQIRCENWLEKMNEGGVGQNGSTPRNPSSCALMQRTEDPCGPKGRTGHPIHSSYLFYPPPHATLLCD